MAESPLESEAEPELSPERRLAQAAKSGNIGAIRSALADGARDVDLALIVSIRERQPEAAAYLLGHGADAQAWNNRPLVRAVETGQRDFVRLLIDNGADPFGRADGLMDIAARNGDWPMTLLLMEEAGVDPDSGGVAALSAAVVAGQLDMAGKLIAQGISPSGQNGRPLRAAAAKGNIEAMAFLLENGANIGAGDHAALSAAARRRGNIEAVRFLLERGAQPAGHYLGGNLSLRLSGDLAAMPGVCALSQAIDAEDPAIIALLLEWDADPSRFNGRFLKQAVADGAHYMVERLLRVGADPLAGDPSPLEFARQTLEAARRELREGEIPVGHQRALAVRRHRETAVETLEVIHRLLEESPARRREVQEPERRHRRGPASNS